jgi:hypothetical protein
VGYMLILGVQRKLGEVPFWLGRSRTDVEVAVRIAFLEEAPPGMSAIQLGRMAKEIPAMDLVYWPAQMEDTDWASHPKLLPEWKVETGDVTIQSHLTASCVQLARSYRIYWPH